MPNSNLVSRLRYFFLRFCQKISNFLLRFRTRYFIAVQLLRRKTYSIQKRAFSGLRFHEKIPKKCRRKWNLFTNIMSSSVLLHCLSFRYCAFKCGFPSSQSKGVTKSCKVSSTYYSEELLKGNRFFGKTIPPPPFMAQWNYLLWNDEVCL